MAYIKEGASNGSHTFELNIRSRFRAYLSRQLSVRIPRPRLPLCTLYVHIPNLLLPTNFISNIKLPTQWGRKLEGWPNTAAGLTGWRRVTRQGCDFVCDGRAVPPAFLYRTGCPNRSCPQLRADRISSCYYIINVHNHPSWATSRKEGMAWYSSRPMPSLYSYPFPPFLLLVIGQLWKMACLRGPTRFHIHTQLNLQLENKCHVQIHMQHIGLCP